MGSAGSRYVSSILRCTERFQRLEDQQSAHQQVNVVHNWSIVETDKEPYGEESAVHNEDWEIHHRQSGLPCRQEIFYTVVQIVHLSVNRHGHFIFREAAPEDKIVFIRIRNRNRAVVGWADRKVAEPEDGLHIVAW